MAGVSLSTPRARFAWQAWYFLHLRRRQRKLGDILGLMWRRGLWRGRRVTFNTSGSICVAGVVLSPRSFAWQACHFQHLGLDSRGRRDTFCTSIDVSGLMWRRGLLRGRTSAEAWRHSGTDVAPRSLAWQACHFQHLGLDLRGRRGAFCDVSGSLATFWD